MGKSSFKKRVFILAAIILVVAVAAFAIREVYHTGESAAKADKVMETMMELVPGLKDGGVTDRSGGSGEVRAMSIDGFNVVGCLKVPSLDIMVPVITGGEEESGFAFYDSGSPLADDLKIRGNRNGAFSRISELAPGDKVSFIDIDGILYEYSVVTQYHLKAWDEGDNDMMLCYETDEKTEFVVGLNRE